MDLLIGKLQLIPAYWKEPVNTVDELPTQGNNEGDIRLVKNEKNVYAWLNGEWVKVIANLSNFIDLEDTPDTYSGNGGLFLRVKETEDGIEFAEVISTDEKVKSTADDPEAGYLIDKIDNYSIMLDEENKMMVNPDLFALKDHNHNLQDLADVDNSNIGDGKVLVYNESTGKHEYQEISSTTGSDELVKISSSDTTAGYLYDKIIVGANLSTQVINAGADEDLQISINHAYDDGAVLFAKSGNFSADSSFYYDSLNKRVGIGTNLPEGTLHIYSEDDYGLTVSGVDSLNKYQLRVLGHSGGNAHVQLATDLDDSRLTLIAANKLDQAPRLQLLGPQDVDVPLQGWGLFDFGSLRYTLAGARFLIRYLKPTTYIPMIETVTNQYVLLAHADLNSKVGIGTKLPGEKLQVGEAGDGTRAIANEWATFSDKRLKTNIKDIHINIENFKKIRPREFIYSKDKNKQRHYGFIAQELQKQFPQVVRKSGGYLSVSYTEMIPILVKVIQQLIERIEKLEKITGINYNKRWL